MKFNDICRNTIQAGSTLLGWYLWAIGSEADDLSTKVTAYVLGTAMIVAPGVDFVNYMKQ